MTNKSRIKKLEKEIRERFESGKIFCIQNGCTGEYHYGKWYESVEEMLESNGLSPETEVVSIAFDSSLLGSL